MNNQCEGIEVSCEDRIYPEIRSFIEPACDVFSGAVGAAVGSFGGISGAIAGAALSPILKQVLTKSCITLGDIITGYRPKARAGLGALYAIGEIARRTKLGERIREDGFFENIDGRSSADEIFEGVILKIKDEYEERKARYLVNLFITGVYEASFSREELNHLLKTAEQLTYRQFLLLALFSYPGEFQVPGYNFAGVMMGPEKYSLVMEVLALARRDLIELKANHNIVGVPLKGLPDFNPSQTRLTSEGERLVRSMMLKRMDRQEISNLADQFR